MLRMRRITDQGFVVLTHFVEAGEGAVLSARSVSEELGLPHPTTAKVLKVLQRAGFVTSSRGLTGGYTLACDPAATTVVHVVEAFEGPLGLTECAVEGLITCEAHDTCHLGQNWPFINHAVIDTLNRITLADLVGQTHARRAAAG